MNIIILGAQGRVGQVLTRHLRQKGHSCFAWTRETHDLSDRLSLKDLLFNKTPDFLKKADFIINCAAMSSLEACFLDPVATHLINVMAPGLLAQYCELTHKKFIHLSTDYVLDGTFAGKKKESAKCRPTTIYGQSKEEAEVRVRETCPSSLIFRISWVFGNPDKPAFPELMLERALKGESLSAIGDKWSLPTSLQTLQESLDFFLEERELSGLYHLCDSGEPISWHEYAQHTLLLAQKAGLPLKSREVSPSFLKDYPHFLEKRPLHTALDNSTLAQVLGHPLAPWQETLEKTLFAR